jgi:hypothetical protein
MSPGVHVPEQTPATQVPLPHAVAAPHCPQPPHVSTSMPEHWALPGVHAGAGPHEQLPQEQVDVHDCVPYVLHICVPFGAHAPWPMHPPVCHVPLALHVCVSVPQLPQGIGLVCAGAHVPVHAPPTHVWFEHDSAVPHCPLPQVSTPFPEQRVCPDVHAPASAPLSPS